MMKGIDTFYHEHGEDIFGKHTFGDGEDGGDPLSDDEVGDEDEEESHFTFRPNATIALNATSPIALNATSIFMGGDDLFPQKNISKFAAINAALANSTLTFDPMALKQFPLPPPVNKQATTSEQEVLPSSDENEPSTDKSFGFEEKSRFFVMADGGNVEGAGLLTAVSAGHDTVFVVFNGGGNYYPKEALKCLPERNWVCKNETRETKAARRKCLSKYINPTMLQFFVKTADEKGQMHSMNVIFEEGDLLTFVEESVRTMATDNGIAFKTTFTTVRNEHFKIEAGRKVTVTSFVVVSDMPLEAAVPKNWLADESAQKRFRRVQEYAHKKSFWKLNRLMTSFLSYEHWWPHRDQQGCRFCSYNFPNLGFWQVDVMWDLRMGEPNLVRAWVFADMVAWMVKKYFEADAGKVAERVKQARDEYEPPPTQVEYAF